MPIEAAVIQTYDMKTYKFHMYRITIDTWLMSAEVLAKVYQNLPLRMHHIFFLISAMLFLSYSTASAFASSVQSMAGIWLAFFK